MRTSAPTMEMDADAGNAKRRTALDTHGPIRSLEQTADELHRRELKHNPDAVRLSRQRIQQIERGALRKLRALLSGDDRTHGAWYIDGIRVDRVEGGWAAHHPRLPRVIVRRCPWVAAWRACQLAILRAGCQARAGSTPARPIEQGDTAWL